MSTNASDKSQHSIRCADCMQCRQVKETGPAGRYVIKARCAAGHWVKAGKHCTVDIHRIHTKWVKRIREAVAEAVKHRDRYAEDRVKELTTALSKAADDVAAQVRRFEDRLTLKPWQQMRVAILRDLQDEINGMATELRDSWKVGIRDNVTGSLHLGIEDGVGQLEAMQAPDFKDLTDVSRNALVKRTFATIDRAAVDFLANYQVQLLGDVSTELASGIHKTITAGVLSGKSIPEVAREIGRVVEDKEAFRRAGKTVFKTAQRRATLIARTETLRAHNEGRNVFCRQVGVTRVQWLTAHDERTCPVCRPLDGKVFGIEQVDVVRHPGCRCTWTPA